MLPEETYARIRLWFFRDLSEDQRMHLFALCGFPVPEVRNQMIEAVCLDWIIDQLIAGGRPVKPPRS